MRGNTPPISTPDRLVFTEPIVLRYSIGADILGSKVSTCVGPPPSHSHTTDVFLVGLPELRSAARSRRRSDSMKLPRPRDPIFRKSRRVAPSHVLPLRECQRFS